MSTLFDTLCTQLHVEPDYRGEVWIDCPWCGKGKKHFSFSARGYKCFSCDRKGKGLAAIAEQLRVSSDTPAAPRRALPPPPPRNWQKRPELWLERFCGALDRVQAWQGYKPLTLDSIARHRLGVGVLPASRCDKRRLIVPVFSQGRLVAFHGRAYQVGDTDAKWLTSGGSSKQVLFNADSLRPGATVVIVENFVDAVLVMQAEPGIVAVAGGGASWNDLWTAQIAESRPRHVLVLLDNDLAGWPNAATYRALRGAWEKEHPGLAPPEPRGPKIATALARAGVRTVRGPNWPSSTPPKWDVGSDLARRAA